MAARVVDSLVLRERSVLPTAAALSALTVAAAVLAVAGPSAYRRSPELLSLSIAFLLIVELPVLVWLTWFLRRGATLFWLVPMASLGLLMARFAVPIELRAEGFAAEMASVVAPLQMVALGRALVLAQRRVRAAPRPAAGPRDLLTRLRRWASLGWPGSRLAQVLVYELAVLAYAAGLGGVGRRHGGGSMRGPRSEFTLHRNTGLRAVLWVALFLMAVEVGALHLVVSGWNQHVAWALTGLELYGAVWLVGLIRSLPLRPIEIREDSAWIRYGLVYDLMFAREDLEGVASHPVGIDVERSPDLLYCAYFGQPNVVLTLRRPIEAWRPYGLTREVRRVALMVDEPDALAVSLTSTSERADQVR